MARLLLVLRFALALAAHALAARAGAANASCASISRGGLDFTLNTMAKTLSWSNNRTGWRYSLSLCGRAPGASAFDGACAGSALAYQKTQGECVSLADVRDDEVQVASSGLSVRLSGGQGGRSALVSLQCADVKRSAIESVGEGSCGGACYHYTVASQSGCPAQCPLDARNGRVCSGADRGECRIVLDPPSAGCICKQGISGAACEDGKRDPVPSLQPALRQARTSAPEMAPPLTPVVLAFACAVVFLGVAHRYLKQESAAWRNLLVAASVAAALLALATGISSVSAGFSAATKATESARTCPSAGSAARSADAPLSAAAQAALLSVGTFATDPVLQWEMMEPSLLLPADAAAPRASILLIGDSVDRNLVLSGCAGLHIAEFGAGVLAYEYTPATHYCSLFYGSLGNVHMFGSRPDGPYYNPGHVQRDAFEATRLRLPMALQLYAAANAGVAPNCVIYQTGLYDLSAEGGRDLPFLMSSEQRVERIKTFVGDVIDAVDLLASHLPSGAVVLLRTTPLSKLSDGRQYELQAEFNAALRHVGALKDLGVIDWEAMTRSQWKGYLRDDSHPNEAHSKAFIDVVSGFCRQVLKARAVTETSR
jgi:hypothetical protein